MSFVKTLPSFWESPIQQPDMAVGGARLHHAVLEAAAAAVGALQLASHGPKPSLLVGTRAMRSLACPAPNVTRCELDIQNVTSNNARSPAISTVGHVPYYVPSPPPYPPNMVQLPPPPPPMTHVLALHTNLQHLALQGPRGHAPLGYPPASVTGSYGGGSVAPGSYPGYPGY
jgi:hypothetical protein